MSVEEAFGDMNTIDQTMLLVSYAGMEYILILYAMLRYYGPVAK